jgi:hypothetical protein
MVDDMMIEPNGLQLYQLRAKLMGVWCSKFWPWISRFNFTDEVCVRLVRELFSQNLLMFVRCECKESFSGSMKLGKKSHVFALYQFYFCQWFFKMPVVHWWAVQIWGALTVLVRHRRSVRTLLRSPSWLQGE